MKGSGAAWKSPPTHTHTHTQKFFLQIRNLLYGKFQKILNMRTICLQTFLRLIYLSLNLTLTLPLLADKLWQAFQPFNILDGARNSNRREAVCMQAL